MPVETDGERTTAVANLFRDRPAIRVLHGDRHDILTHSLFDLLFVDASPAKYGEPALVGCVRTQNQRWSREEPVGSVSFSFYRPVWRRERETARTARGTRRRRWSGRRRGATGCSAAAPAGAPSTSARARRSTTRRRPLMSLCWWRLQYKLSLRNVAEMFLTRGFTFTHETTPAWEERVSTLCPQGKNRKDALAVPRLFRALLIRLACRTWSQ